MTTSKYPPTQLALFVTIHVRQEDADALAAAHRSVWAACGAEPECLVFDVWQDPLDHGHFKFFEVWSRNRDWFERVSLPFLAPKSRFLVLYGFLLCRLRGEILGPHSFFFCFPLRELLGGSEIAEVLTRALRVTRSR